MPAWRSAGALPPTSLSPAAERESAALTGSNVVLRRDQAKLVGAAAPGPLDQLEHGGDRALERRLVSPMRR